MRRNFSAAQERCPPENHSLFATRCRFWLVRSLALPLRSVPPSLVPRPFRFCPVSLVPCPVLSWRSFMGCCTLQSGAVVA